ncbi:small subunit processome component 20 homolog [Saccostrea echinata]|uniref:small subunit processome component 20 homolog n=1 Tax=Saccostrea echinata TaxID=191078 RepID=UPI002A8017BD|nr:small subunit processome component 20 homolog [Saccostrea echinata]
MGKSKAENTFRFQTFTERIASVNIDVIHKIRHHDDTPDETSTYFCEALQKWSELNCTEHFANFRKEISDQVQTFTQLVHHKEEIITALKKHLDIPESLALGPLLNLLVQLARDLQTDFYCYFHDFFDLLVGLLSKNGQNPEILESIFSALSYIFKFLWRYLVRDIKDVYQYFSTLLRKNNREYIVNFAAESFAFLMRKVKNHGELFDFLFLTLVEAPETAEGVGRLLFEMVKGVQKQFHSCAQKTFPVVLSKLGECQDGQYEQLPWDLVESAVTEMFVSMAKHTDKKNSSDIWKILISSVDNVYQNSTKAAKKNKPKISTHLLRLLRLMNIWINHRKGKIVAEPDSVAQCLLTLLRGDSLPEDTGGQLLDVVASLLITCTAVLPVESTVKLVSSVYKTNYSENHVYSFTRTVLDLPIFEKDVLPSLLPYCHQVMCGNNHSSQQQTIHSLTNVIHHKAPPPSDGSQLAQLQAYMLDFGVTKKTGLPYHIMTVLKNTSCDDALNGRCLPEVWSALQLLPHVRPILVKEEAIKNVTALFKNCLKNILSDDTQIPTDEVLNIMYHCILALLYIQDDGEMFSCISLTDVLSLLRHFPDHVTALELADLYFTQASLDGSTSITSEDTLLQVYPILEKNLSSPFSKVRMLSLRILSQFSFRLPSQEEDEATEQLDVFRICLEAELVPLSVQDSRRKLMFLQRLQFDIVQKSIPVGPFILVPLRYLIGSLHIGFKLLWDPVTKLIASHAVGLDKTVFWDLYRMVLQDAAQKCEESLHQTNAMSSTEQEPMEENDDNMRQLFVKSCRSHESIEKPDYANFRFYLWKSMHLFPDLCEKKNRDLVSLLLNFMSMEYYNVDLSAAPTQNLQRQETQVSSEEEEVEEDELDEEEEEEEEHVETRAQRKSKDRQKGRKGRMSESKSDMEEDLIDVEKGGDERKRKTKEKRGNTKGARTKRRAATSALIVHLELFSKFSSPKSLYRETEVRHLYEQLLLHKNGRVQKVAFSCIMTYKHKFLVPYKENFENLLNDAKFKTEIVLFSIDHENSVVSPEHRDQVLPILMRILYGKMHSKTGKDSAGKSHSQFRRSIVFRFLNGCSGEEIIKFMDMVFESFKHFVSDDALTMVCKTEKEIDLSQVIPLRKMNGALNTVDMIVKKLGHLIEGYLPSLHCILLGLTATCVACLERREGISPGAHKPLKNIRQLCITQIMQFYDVFDTYKFSPKEIDAMFHVAVWPQLPKLQYEGIYHPTPLLKLLHMCAANRRYLTLLAKCHDTDPDLTPVSAVLKLLNAKEVNKTVTDFIIEMLNNLLLGEEEEEMENLTMATPVKVNKMVQINVSEIGQFGAELLKPHVSDILTYLQKAIKSIKGHGKRSQTAGKELSILSRISEFVTDQSECLALIELLFPFLGEGLSRLPDTEVNILTSIRNLVDKVKDKKKFYRSFCQLFGYIQNRQSRILLCQLIQVIAENNEELQEIAQLLSELNAWDPKHTEEPDYMKRLNAHKKVNEAIKGMEDELNVDFLLPVLHSCCYCIKNIDDMSLRDNATHTLVTMVKQFSHVTYDQDVFRDLISNGLVHEVKAGFRNKKEHVRHEFIAVLSVLVDTFPSHDMFADLVILKDKDVEADFFENIRHIQTHRRSRALKKMNRTLQSRSVRKEILVSYLLPLTSSFLLDETFAKAQGLQESAIDAMGVLCKQLPWHVYINQLKYFLSLLSKKFEKKKLLVRVIVGILDAFHFDLRNSQHSVNNLPDSVAKKKAKGEITEEPNPFENEELEAENTEETVDAIPTVPEETDETMETNSGSQTKQFDSIVICSVGQATRIHCTIMKSVIPSLQRCLTKKEKSEDEHKLARNNLAEDSEVLRVPIALAMIKLLQNLPHKSLERNLPGILLKVCNFMKSRAVDIRNTARDTLVKITTSLGLRFFPYILSELRGTLRKGYQVHVLCYTVHVLLKNLLPVLKPGELDVCRKSLQDVFHEDLFGQVAEEKEVAGVTSKLFEARSMKSYDSYKILAQVISKESLMAFITPLKEVLDSTHSHTIARKVQEVLKKVVTGLLDNPGLDTESLMIFTHGLITQSFPQLSDKQSKQKETEEKETQSFRPPSCLLLPEEPKRGGDKPKLSKKTNIHVLVEFGLQLLCLCLKRGRLVATEENHCKLVDPFITILVDCLHSKHIRINTLSLRCLCWLLKFKLPSVDGNIKKLANGMFVILKNYASAGASKGENLELISMAFKAVTVLVRDVKIYKLNQTQLQVLLTFCEEDLYDYNRQSTAFSLLKAILSRKLNVPEVLELIKKVEGMSITADSPHVRRECRQIALQYILEYPLGKLLDKHLEFYVTQLSYEMEMGRESALEMLATVFSSFPQNILNDHAGMFFIPMSAALVNDESTKCRKLTALAIKSLLQKIDHNSRKELFNITQRWFTDDKINHRILAVQLTGLFIEVESTKFTHHLSVILPLIQQQIDPGRYEENPLSSDGETEKDRLLFNCLNTLLKLLRECDIIRDVKWMEEMNIIWEYVVSHLGYEHMWVQLASCQLIGLLFAAWTPEEILQPSSSSAQCDFIKMDSIKKLESLALDLIAQLQSQFLTEELANQIIKNMVFIAKVAKLLTDRESSNDSVEKENSGTKDKKCLSLQWLIKKMIREANHEAVNQPKTTIKRSSVFKWVAAVSMDLGPQLLPSVVPVMMPALQRETNENNPNTDSSLKRLAQEVLDILKKILGVETYTQLFAKTHKEQFDRKETRKRKDAVEAVSNPQYAAKKKMKKNLAKREAKKRKIEEYRVSKKIKKRKIKDFAITS